MNIIGKCKVLRVYLGEDEKSGGKRLYDVLLGKLREAGVAGATVTRGLEGFGASSRIHTSRILEAMEDLPVVVEVVDKPARVLKALNAIEDILPPQCLVTVQDVKVLHYHAKGGKHGRTRRL